MKLVSADGTETEATMTEAIYCVAAVKMNLDLAPTKRVVDSFVKRLFDCTIEDLNLDQQHAVAMHIKAGDVQAHAAEVINSRAFNDPAESLVNMPLTNGKKKLIDMTNYELDAQSAQAQEEFAMRRAAEQPTIDLHAERERRSKKLKRIDINSIDLKTITLATPAVSPIDELRPVEPEGPSAGEVECGKLVEIDTALIVNAPFNPRKHFDQVKLEELATSLKHDGQLQNIVVRPHTLKTAKGQHYEIICGERRWRAAKTAGMPTMRCIVIHVSTAKAIELAGMENYKRADFNAIEEAIWFKVMISGAGYTQQKLADHLGISQGQVANRLRLLELPESWQAGVISGEIPATQARDLARWSAYPIVIDEVDRGLKRWKEFNEGFPNHEKFKVIISDAAVKIGRPIVGGFSIPTERGGHRAGEVAFKPTDDQRQELRIETVDTWRGNKEKLAYNIELWEQLQAAGAKDRKKREQTKLDKAATKSPNGSAKSEIASAEARHKTEREREERDRMRRIWIVNHIKSLIRSSVDIFLDSQIRTIVYVTEAFSDSGLMKAAISFAGGKPVKITGYGHDAIDLIASLSTLPEAGIVALEKMERKLVDLWAQEEVTWTNDRALGVTAKLAAWLHIDPITSWHPTKECLELFTLEEMRAIGKEWKFHAAMIAIAQDRAAMMNLLLTPGPRRPMPAILAKLLPKTKPVKTKKGKK